MSIIAEVEPQTLADLLERLGNIPLQRVLIQPAPGTATEEDLVRLRRKSKRLYELVEGTLVEKTMGFLESSLAMWMGHLLHNFLVGNDLGVVSGADGTLRLMAGLIRIPDVAFIRWENLPGRQLPEEPVPDLAPDLAIEVLSEGNTPAEMQRKCKEYFLAGTTLVWLVDPRARTVVVHTAPEVSTTLREGDILDGGAILPGLALPVAQVFERLPTPAPTRPARRKKKPSGQ